MHVLYVDRAMGKLSWPDSSLASCKIPELSVEPCSSGCTQNGLPVMHNMQLSVIPNLLEIRKPPQPAIFQTRHVYVHPVYMRNNIFISLYIRAWSGLLHVFTMLYCRGSGWIGAKAAEMEIEGFLGSKPLDPAWSKSVQAQRRKHPSAVYARCTSYDLYWSQMWWTRLDMCWKSVEHVSKYSEYNHVLFHVVPPCSPWILNDPHGPTEKCALRGRPPSVR